MATPFLISLPLPPNANPTGLTLKQISYFGRVLIRVSSLSQAEDFIRQNFRLLDVYVDVTEIPSSGDIVDILNAGAAKVFVSPEQLIALSQEQDVPSSRLALYDLSNAPLNAYEKYVAQSKEKKDAGLVTGLDNVEPLVDKLGKDFASQNLYKVFSARDSSEETLKQAMKQGATIIVPSETLTVERNVDGKISASGLVAAQGVADEHSGLYATSVTDERGTCLGLVWSSDESIAEALRTGTGVYQSRKRGLWYKGQSSGDVQELLRIGYDCDSDCLLFVVKQIGRGMATHFASCNRLFLFG